jgi:hypothetical protein
LQALSLYLRGGLLEQAFDYATPVVLFVSSSNPGAAEAAEEMTSTHDKISITTTMPQPSAIRTHGPQMFLSLMGGAGKFAEAVAAASAARASVISGKAAAGTVIPAAARAAAQGDTDTITAGAAASGQATHFLLYLNKQTFYGPEGEELAEQVWRRCEGAGVKSSRSWCGVGVGVRCVMPWLSMMCVTTSTFHAPVRMC